MTKFEIDADVLLVETPFDVLVTFRNEGDADAGPFQGAVEELNTDDTGQPVFDPFAVEGQIAPGDSRKISLSVTVQQAGNWTFTAIADFQNEVAESNENDNSRQVQALVRSGLPDFQWANGEGFSFTPSQTKPGTYDVSLDFINKGTSDYDGQPLFIGYTWYRDEGGSGDFPPVPMGDLPVNEERTLTQNVQSPGPGTYTIYAILDKDHLADQLNYDNDESSIRLTVN